LFIGGENVGIVKFAKTGKLNNWNTAEMKVAFKKGGNFIKVVSAGKGLHLDAIAITK